MERREAVITGLVLAVTCGLIAALTLVARETTGDLAVSSPAVETASVSDLDGFVDEATKFIEAVRGREFLVLPEVVALNDADFVARVEADFATAAAEDPDELVATTAAYRALGLIGRLESYIDVVQSFGATGILGFYDPESDELVVRQVDDLSLLTKSTIVHELTHAFDDQHFDLDREEYDERTDEIPWTFRAVAEGSASWVEAEWESLLSPADQIALAEEELNFADPGAFDRFEISYLLLEYAVYELGNDFVDRLVEAGGTAALDDAIVAPPPTSEQLIVPESFLAGEPPLDVEPPSADAEVLLDGVGGQVLIRALFQGVGIDPDIEWGGDWMVVWSDGALSCIRWDIKADSVTARDTLQNRFELWADTVGSASVRSLDDATIRVDRCI